MNFLIADTFTASLTRLTNEEQKLVKTAPFDLHLNPANPGTKLHKLDAARDKRFWSARVGSDIRLILHRTEGSLLLCYVAHHDNAYDWAARRKLETHPTTGAAQFVEIPERVVVIEPIYGAQALKTKIPATQIQPLARVSETELLSFGVPQEWAPTLRTATED